MKKYSAWRLLANGEARHHHTPHPLQSRTVGLRGEALLSVLPDAVKLFGVSAVPALLCLDFVAGYVVPVSSAGSGGQFVRPYYTVLSDFGVCLEQ